MGLVSFLVIGAVAGWLSGALVQGRGFGLLGNVVVGVIGAVLGGHLLGWLGLRGTGLTGQLVTAVVGALVLLWVAGLTRRR